MGFPPLSMESIPCSQLADFLHMETRDAILEKTTLTAVRTRCGDLQLGLGAGLEERKAEGRRNTLISYRSMLTFGALDRPWSCGRC